MDEFSDRSSIVGISMCTLDFRRNSVALLIEIEAVAPRALSGNVGSSKLA